MVVSMTGYGRGNSENEKVKVTVEIKTVNHRYSEYMIRMPRQLLILEDKLKRKANEYIKRGRAEIFIAVEGEGLVSKRLQIDWKLADQFFALMESVKDKYSLSTTATMQDLLQLNELVSVEEEHAENGELEEILFSALTVALEGLKKMRVREGLGLKVDLSNQVCKVKVIIEELKAYAPSIANQYRVKLTQRISEIVEGQIDESRLLTEVALFADKTDINEEITRLESHLIQFSETMEHQEPIGRKLDFIVQEMNREVNTIGSKANDSQITKNVVEMKSLLEKMKEQVQNIE